ncbi:MAG: hypothetical protein ACM359_03635, partial [Bacillota bacterium]
YDRRPKFDLQKLHAITSREAAYERGDAVAPQPQAPKEIAWTVLVGAAQDGALNKPYRYSTEIPSGEWMAQNFDDSTWKSGVTPFGRDAGRPTIRTPWTTSDIYLRRSFEFAGNDIKRAAIVLSHDEDTEIYVNGQKVLEVKNYNTNYQLFDVTEALRKALKKGANTLAVHTHQTTGGQYIDLAVLVE